jgi:hypothetical protein
LGNGAVETLRFGVGIDDENVHLQALRILIIQSEWRIEIDRTINGTEMTEQKVVCAM